MSTWDETCIDSLSGKTIVVTGGTHRAGLQAVKEFIQNDASVIIGTDDEQKGEEAVTVIRAKFPEAKIIARPLDLGSHSSISTFVRGILHDHPTVDVLINNASPAGARVRRESRDGHEYTFAVNYLGHFILTCELFPLLLRGHDPRVICVSDLTHKDGFLNFEDLDYHQEYTSHKAFAQAKLALLTFALELNRRCVTHGIHLKSIPVHCGRKGALPLLFASTSLEARGGVYYGPDGFKELWGHPTEVPVAVQAENFLSSGRLWEESEKMARLRFDVTSSKTIGLH